jgi:hypothetical protein
MFWLALALVVVAVTPVATFFSVIFALAIADPLGSFTVPGRVRVWNCASVHPGGSSLSSHSSRGP